MIIDPFYNTEKPTDSSELAIVEEVLGLTLPQHLIDFWTQCNGGYTRPGARYLPQSDHEIIRVLGTKSIMAGLGNPFAPCPVFLTKAPTTRNCLTPWSHN
ncbi:MAG: SMI1/KNR4 family protein [Pirellulaceae bacterium]